MALSSVILNDAYFLVSDNVVTHMIILLMIMLSGVFFCFVFVLFCFVFVFVFSPTH